MKKRTTKLANLLLDREIRRDPLDEKTKVSTSSPKESVENNTRISE